MSFLYNESLKILYMGRNYTGHHIQVDSARDGSWSRPWWMGGMNGGAWTENVGRITPGVSWAFVRCSWEMWAIIITPSWAHLPPYPTPLAPWSPSKLMTFFVPFHSPRGGDGTHSSFHISLGHFTSNLLLRFYSRLWPFYYPDCPLFMPSCPSTFRFSSCFVSFLLFIGNSGDTNVMLKHELHAQFNMISHSFCCRYFRIAVVSFL